ncbi:MAG: hypothetical protein AB9856_05390 [Cellulosilyticaceae bacterium]
MIIIRMIQLAFLGSFGYTLWRQDMVGMAAVGVGFLLTFAVPMLQKILKVKIPKGLNMVYLIFLLAAQLLGTYLRAYDRFPWWDVALHGASAILVGFLTLLVLGCFDKDQVLLKNKCYGAITTFVFLGIAASAALWEISEFVGDQLLGTNAQLGSLVDTMEDMIICVAVGVPFCIYLYLTLKKERDDTLSKQVYRCKRKDTEL